MFFSNKPDKQALLEQLKVPLVDSVPDPEPEFVEDPEEREPEVLESPSVNQFLQAEFAGVTGVRVRELEERAKEAGVESKALTRAIHTGPYRIVAHPFLEGEHLEWLPWGELEVRDSLVRLLGYGEWKRFLVDLCESSERMRAQAWQFRDELKERGTRVRDAEVEDALFELAGELLPETPAGSCDHREVLFREAVMWVVENQPSSERRLEFAESTAGIWSEGSLGEFREALRGRMRAAVRGKAA